MFRHFLLSLSVYTLIIFTSLLIVGIAKEEEMGKGKAGTKKDASMCKAFKFDRCS